METIVIPNTSALEKEIALFVGEVQKIKVSNQLEYEVAVGFVKDIKTKKRTVEDTFKAIKNSAAQTHKQICALEAARWRPLDEAERVIKRSMSNYLTEEDRRRREEERRLQEAARKEAEEETLRQAEQVEKHLGREAADAVLEMPILAPVVSVEKVDKGVGVSQRKTYSAEVTDLAALVRACAAGEAPLACLAADTKFLNNQARALKTEMRYPGVKLVETNDLAIRTGS